MAIWAGFLGFSENDTKSNSALTDLLYLLYKLDVFERGMQMCNPCVSSRILYRQLSTGGSLLSFQRFYTPAKTKEEIILTLD